MGSAHLELATVAVAAAIASAALFGLSTSLQHRVAESTPTTVPGGTAFLASLTRHRSWRVGIALSVVAFGLHGGAIAIGGLALVQPFIITGIVFAVWMRAGLDRRWPVRTEIAWSVVTWAGLAAFVVALRPGPPMHAPDRGELAVWACVAVSIAAILVRLGGVVRTREVRGLCLGGAAGVLFGLVAVLLKAVAMTAIVSPWHALADWPPWLMVAVGLWAMSLNQRAYRTTRLSVSMPVLNVVDVIVALGLAAVLLGDQFGVSPLRLAVVAASAASMTFGISRLARREEITQASLVPAGLEVRR